VDLLLRAWSSVHEQHPQSTLVIVGEGEQAETLSDQAGKGVIFSGGVDDVRPYLQSADMFVLPSSTEGLSNSLLEAMAVGLPVIATAVGGAPDLIDDKINGWLVPPYDIEAIQVALTGLIEAPDFRNRLGTAARETVLECYSLPVVAQQLRSLYEETIEARPKLEREKH